MGQKQTFKENPAVRATIWLVTAPFPIIIIHTKVFEKLTETALLVY